MLIWKSRSFKRPRALKRATYRSRRFIGLNGCTSLPIGSHDPYGPMLIHPVSTIRAKGLRAAHRRP
jgi:hypothetical protein